MAKWLALDFLNIVFGGIVEDYIGNLGENFAGYWTKNALNKIEEDKKEK